MPSLLEIPDHDADFEATLAQLDEIGIDGWIPPSPRDVRLAQSDTLKNVKEVSVCDFNNVQYFLMYVILFPFFFFLQERFDRQEFSHEQQF